MKRIVSGFTLIEWMIVVTIIAILVAIAIPAYKGYVIRGQVSEGMALVGDAQASFAKFYARNGHYPSSNASVGLAPASSIRGKYVGAVNVASTAGKITVGYGYKGSRTDAELLAQGSNELVLSAIASGGSIAWVCGPSGGTTIDPKYLPESCRDGSSVP
jgi:type IV pilus assembly protein PilA